ncbi:MAG: amidohydrolase [Bacteroidales bacterium]|nr:amidohydrolase [Bacteroidales bacterium]
MDDLFKAALVQTNISWKNPKENLLHFQELIENCKNSPQLFVLPEMFTTGFLSDPAAFAEPMDGPAVTWMLLMAGKTGSYIAGSLIIRDDGKFFNRFVFASPDGRLQHYDKRHLFRIKNEEVHYQNGNQRKVIIIDNWRICPMICYDLRFPVWSRSRNDYDVLVYTANWPQVRMNVWEVLLQARAIENLSYCIGVNRTGLDGNGIKYNGGSRAIDFMGEIVTELQPGFKGIEIVELSRQKLEQFRNDFPVHKDADKFRIEESQL